jgi:hypothetical protein
MGDDHIPRTTNWASRLLSDHGRNQNWIWYGKDGIQNRNKPTWWSMDAEIVRRLGKMVPAPVQHLYCDDAVKALGEKAGCLGYDETIMVEHMHPVAGKGRMDAQYERVNRLQQYDRDSQLFRSWVTDGLDRDDWIDRCLRGARAAIENRSGWPTFWKTETVETRTIDVSGQVVPVRRSGYSYIKVLLRDGIASSIGFAVAGYSTSASLLPTSSVFDGKPFDSIKLPYGSLMNDGMLDVTAQWGWPEVPDDIIWAHQMQSNRLYRRKGSPEGIAGSAEWGLTRIPALDPDVLAILKGGGYMRAGIDELPFGEYRLHADARKVV